MAESLPTTQAVTTSAEGLPPEAAPTVDTATVAPPPTEAQSSVPSDSPTAGLPIEVQSVYKIFGPQPEAMLEKVREGMGKAELLEKHGHVLGLNNVSMSIGAGSIHVVMGLSGSGKSTLVRHFNRLIEPTAGVISVGGEDVMALNERDLRQFRAERIAMVFQKFALFPHYTIAQNVAYGLEVRGLPRAQREEQAQHWLSRVGLEGYGEHYPAQLSGGMQQRVGLARALAADTPVLLMDEAFSALDPLIRTEMQDLLLELQQDLGKTIVFITHDLDEALRLGERIAILREGEVVQEGSATEIVLKPADDYIANFVRGINRGKVIQCRMLVQKGPPIEGPSLAGNLVIEEAARTLSAAGAEQGNVVNRRGRHLGTINLAAIVGAMVPPTESPADATSAGAAQS